MDFTRFKKTQKKVLKLIENSYKKNRLVHAYLFEGAKGTPKIEGAYYLANLLMCRGENKPCGECLDCQRILNGEHPRIFYIEPIQDTIKKEQIEALEHEFSRVSLEEGVRVFIIKDIDKATLSASNSILKFLEEMNENNYGILITESLQNVLLTIRSRSQIVSFNKVTYEDNVKEYTDKGIDLEVSNVLAKITNNTDEGVEYIKEGKIIDIIDLVKKINRTIVLKENPYLKFYENSRFLFDDNNKKNHQMFMDLLILITNDRIYKILGRDDEITFTNEIENLVNDMEMDYQKTFNQLEKIIEFKGRMKYNLNLDLMYMQMFIEIMR